MDQKTVTRLGEVMVKMFTNWKAQTEVLGEKVGVVGFDSWVSGFVGGYTLSHQDFDISEIKSEIDFLVASDIAKECGVTGTLFESFKTSSLNE